MVFALLAIWRWDGLCCCGAFHAAPGSLGSDKTPCKGYIKTTTYRDKRIYDLEVYIALRSVRRLVFELM